MNDKTIRNVVIAVVAVVALLIVLGIVGSLLSSIVPLAIVAAIAFFLGRKSVNTNLLEAASDLVSRARQPAGQIVGAARSVAVKPDAEKPAETEKSAADPAMQKTVQRNTKKTDARLTSANKTLEDTHSGTSNLSVKTADQLQEESRRLEEEVARRTANYDPTAAIEERKRRLLGDQGEKS
jgi:biopolymer transport protein ExbB/TolQ